MHVDWPAEALRHPGFETWSTGSQKMVHGPRVKIGMAAGSVLKQTPSALAGRSDYFGAFPCLVP